MARWQPGILPFMLIVVIESERDRGSGC